MLDLVLCISVLCLTWFCAFQLIFARNSFEITREHLKMTTMVPTTPTAARTTLTPPNIHEERKRARQEERHDRQSNPNDTSDVTRCLFGCPEDNDGLRTPQRGERMEERPFVVRRNNVRPEIDDGDQVLRRLSF